MMTYENYKSWQYIESFLSQKQNSSQIREEFEHWHYSDEDDFPDGVSFFEVEKIGEESKASKVKLTIFVEKLKTALKKEHVFSRNFQKNLNMLGKLAGLKSYEKDIIQALFLYEKCDLFERFCDYFFGSKSWSEPYNLALLFQKSAQKISASIQNDSPLLTSKILSRENYRNKLEINEWVRNLLTSSECSEKIMIRRIIGAPLKSDLTLNDFDYIPDMKKVIALLKNSFKKNLKGINILLYGAPGTGKTEFAKVAAKSAGFKIFSVGEVSTRFRDSVAECRIQRLTFSNKILKTDVKTIFLVDEAEDIFESSQFYRRTVSKLEINKILETNQRPIIWVTNNISGMDKAYLRRFTKLIHFEEPSCEIRENIWAKQFKKYGMNCDETSIKEFAKEYAIPPSFVDTAVRTSKLMNGNLEDVKDQLQEMEKAYHNGTLPVKEKKNDIAFNPNLLNTDIDLEKLCTQLKSLKRLDFSLCLYGAPGTGKSAFARHIANQLGLNVVQKRASDLLDKYVGGTEENIAKAFAEARKNKALLIFDEADSFLQDRRNATKSWEVTEVNEMLTWMESHPYPFVCTTNLMDNLDPASLRRFTFKVKYDYLTPNQIQIAFEHFFNIKLDFAPNLNSLSPGDFAVVKKKTEILGVMEDSSALIQLLKAEQKCKEPSHTKIGFL